MKKPDFFLVGAPKCGTTALSEYLREHPQVFMSTPKEPHYFATDFPGLRYVTDLKDYERQFSRFGPPAVVAGEASPGYLVSREAVGRIRAYNPAARLIVTLRNPLDLLVSYHAQLLYSAYEDEPDLERAWSLQERRQQGQAIPAQCREPKVLQYREVMALGDQLARLLEVFPRQQVLVLFYDDFRADPGAVYRAVLAFLGLPDDSRRSFAVVNPQKQPRFGWFNRLLHRPPAWMLAVMRRLVGSRLHDLLVWMHGLFKRLNTKSAARQTLSREFRARLAREFLAQIELLERLTGRDLGDWKRANDGN